MKTKIVIILCALAGTVHATLIDLTPGGFSFFQPLPTVVDHFFGQYGVNLENIAGANIVNGQPVWSPFTIFGDDRFSLTMNAEGTGANVSWDLSGTPWHLRFVFAENNDLLAHLYRPVGREQIMGEGFISIDDLRTLDAGTFAGATSIPDTGSTLALLSIGLLGLLFVATRRQNVLS